MYQNLQIRTLGKLSTSKTLSCYFQYKTCTEYKATGTWRSISTSTHPSTPQDIRLSIHDGYLIQASLCISRLPLRYVEPQFEKEWREFSERWLTRTKNLPLISDDLLSYKLPITSTSSSRQVQDNLKKPQRPIKRAISKLKNGNISSESSELDELLSQESTMLSNLHKKGTESRSIKTPSTVKKQKMIEKPADDEQNEQIQLLQRKPTEYLYLLIKYKSKEKWELPRVTRNYNQTMRQTISRLCEKHFGLEYSPYLLGCCPFSVEKRKSNSNQKPWKGKKIFYYKGLHIPGSSNIVLNSNLPFEDFAWVTYKEMTSMLDFNALKVLKPGIYLD